MVLLLQTQLPQITLFPLHLAVISPLHLAVFRLYLAMLFLRRRYEDQPASPRVLLRGWYYDSGISAFMGGPGRRAFDAVTWFDRTVVDGAVNGVATLVRGGGGGLRRTQTGFVRAYAGFLTAGAILVVFVMVLRGALL